MEYINREQYGSRIARSDLQAGDTVVMRWSPYGWAADNEGYVGSVRVTVLTAPADDIIGDGRLELPDGRVLTDYGEGRRHIGGDATSTESVPDRTDVGTGATFYEVAE